MKTITLEDIRNMQTNGPIVALMGRVVGKQMTMRILNEMVGYKAIEENIGISLFILFYALEHGAYFKNPYYKNQIHHFQNLKPNWDVQKKCFDLRMSWFVKPYHYSSGGCLFLFKDYGKTWALTREELE